VRSYTSNSNCQCPDGPWRKTWLGAMVLTLALLVGWEGTLRSLGHRPTVVDDMALWAAQRDRVYTDCCERAVVLLGDCRMQLGLVPPILAERFPGYRVVQLAVQETSPVAALRDLAADENFNGIVVCALNARLLCKDMWDTQQPYVDYYHRKYSLNEKLNRFFSILVQRTFTIVHPQLRLDDLVVHLVKEGRLPSPYYIETHADRSRLADYSGVDLEAHRAYALGRANWLYTGRSLPSSVRWLEDAMEVEGWVKAIQARGGRVIFVQFPTTGANLRFDEFMFPKARYWDAFAAQTSALCLHFAEVPELSGFDCPDTSHLDRTEAPRFTLELGKVLEDHGLLGTPLCVVASAQGAGPQAKCPCHSTGGHRGKSAQCLHCAPGSARQSIHHKTASERS